MDDKRRKRLWFAATIIVVSGLATGKGIRSYYLRRQEFKKIEAQFGETQKRVQLKQWRLARAVKDDVFLEREARRQLGLIADGEIEFRWNKAPAVKIDAVPPSDVSDKAPRR